MHDAARTRATRTLFDVGSGRPLLVLRHPELRHYNSWPGGITANVRIDEMVRDRAHRRES
jgi:hypothetical protein